MALTDPAAREQEGYERHSKRNYESRRKQRSTGIAENVTSVLKSILRALPDPQGTFRYGLSLFPFYFCLFT